MGCDIHLVFQVWLGTAWATLREVNPERDWVKARKNPRPEQYELVKEEDLPIPFSADSSEKGEDGAELDEDEVCEKNYELLRDFFQSTDRDYTLFSKLANVRNGGDFTRVYSSRGFPFDLSPLVEQYHGWCGGDHSFSYLSLDEILRLDVTEWRQGPEFNELRGIQNFQRFCQNAQDQFPDYPLRVILSFDS